MLSSFSFSAAVHFAFEGGCPQRQRNLKKELQVAPAESSPVKNSNKMGCLL